MQGAGNDFVVLDCTQNEFNLNQQQLRRIADRHFGVGCDQVLVVERPSKPEADFRYRIFNADGGEVEQCGNGARCIARHIGERAAAPQSDLVLDSPGGLVQAQLKGDRVSVTMGVPDFNPASLPFEASGEAYVYPLSVGASEIEIGAVSVGNPHAVIRVPAVADAPVARLGPAIENHSRFPRRTNVGFMEVVDRGHIRLRVHERGTGETRACGTGACAAVAVGRRHGLLDENVQVDLPGGRLDIQWKGPGEPIWMTGPAERAFEGEVQL
jgi:diaminopimelate epimerase